MFEWVRKLFLNAKEQGAALQKLEQQAYAAKEQLNESLELACSSSSPAAMVSHLLVAKSKFAELQAIASEHPKMRLKNEDEVDAAIKQLEQDFSRAGYFAIHKQSASAHVSLSPAARDLLQ